MKNQTTKYVEELLEMARSNEVLRGANGEIAESASYLASAQKTVQQGDLVSSSNYNYGNSRTLIFERTLSDGQKMQAMVAVTDNGDVQMLTYFKKD